MNNTDMAQKNTQKNKGKKTNTRIIIKPEMKIVGAKPTTTKKRPSIAATNITDVRLEKDPNHLKPLLPIEKTDMKTQLVILSFLLFVGVTCLVAGTILGLANLNKLKFLNRGSLPHFTLPEAITLKNSRFATNETAYQSGTVSQGDIHVADPYTVISDVIKNDSEIILIDLRPSDTFKDKHVKNSVSIPFSGSEKESKSFVEKVEQIRKGKPVVLLPYSAASTTGEQAYILLDDRGIDTSVMKQGWNELYNLPNMWVPEDKWQSFGMEKWVEFKE
jgi:rhodanese-related sulfurtransferase